MESIWIERIAKQLQIKEHQVSNTVEMLEGGATIPFIARYRKEKTGSLDETIIDQIRHEFTQLRELSSRKETILSAIEEQGKLSPDLKKRIENCFDPVILEDLYLPYKKKRETKADKARKWGLEPLADLIQAQKEGAIFERARSFLNKDITTPEAAIEGAQWIIAERFNELQELRERLRTVFREHARVSSKESRSTKADKSKYRDYFNHDEKADSIPSHRLLAILRGEQEGALTVHIVPDEERTIASIRRTCYNPYGKAADLLETALVDSYKRLLSPAIENQIRQELKEKADQHAISVFTQNLRQLLLAPPLGPQPVLAIDPGYRTGCKTVCLDEQGNLKEYSTWYIHTQNSGRTQAEEELGRWMEKYRFRAVAVGDGTAGKETAEWLRTLLRDTGVEIYMVDESGASIYSASAIAREEFPALDLTVRGAISIGRRLIDPMAELIKIDPKSIGVGQYQHDVDQKALKEALDTTVVSCVHQVGVRLNTASVYLLSYLGGIGPALAKNIVTYRETQGPFRDLASLLKVPKLGPRAFELSAGFMRIPDGSNPLDNTGVHPESYPLVKRMAKSVGSDVGALVREGDLRKQIILENFTSEETGMPTLMDIMKELEKPGLDPRGVAETFEYDARIQTIEDLSPGMILQGQVTNITQFGVFVDLGIKENGLIHISQLSDQFVKDPATVIQLREKLTVRVLEVDKERKRISLSRKGL